MSTYTSGRRVEHLVRDELVASGYTVIRAAASKGPADLVAFAPGTVVFVQCKRSGTCSPAERAALLQIAGLVGGLPVAAQKPPRKPTTFRRLTGPGPKDWTRWQPNALSHNLIEE